MSGKRAPALVSILFLVLVGCLSIYVYQLTEAWVTSQQKLRSLNRANLLKARINSIINLGVTMARSVDALVKYNPDITEPEFSSFMSAVHPVGTPISHTAVAPDMIVRFIYPMADNEAALGLDYLKNDDQRAMVLQALRQGSFVLAGPLDLVQGGQALVLRYPLGKNSSDESGDVWGILAIVIRYGEFLDYCQIEELQEEYFIRLTGRDAQGSNGDIFFDSSGGAMPGKPQEVNIPLPNGSWLLGIIPINGWGLGQPVSMLFSGILLLATLISSVVGYRVTSVILTMRKTNTELSEVNTALTKRNEEINRLNEELTTYEYAISNAMRVPARQIKESIELLQDETTGLLQNPESRIHWLKKINSHSTDLLELMSELCLLGSIVSTGLKTSEFDLDMLLTSVITEIKSNKETLRCDYKITEKLYLNCDRTLFKLCIRKLIEFFEVVDDSETKEIIISGTSEEGDIQEVHMTSKHVNLTDRDIESLLSPFFNFHQRDSFIGTELGLFISRRVAEVHGASLTAERYSDSGLRINIAKMPANVE